MAPDSTIWKCRFCDYQVALIHADTVPMDTALSNADYKVIADHLLRRHLGSMLPQEVPRIA